jgi:hypothetical protein
MALNMQEYLSISSDTNLQSAATKIMARKGIPPFQTPFYLYTAYLKTHVYPSLSLCPFSL